MAKPKPGYSTATRTHTGLFSEYAPEPRSPRFVTAPLAAAAAPSPRAPPKQDSAAAPGAARSPTKVKPSPMPSASVRWCALSRSLWCMLVPEGNTHADEAGLRSFLDVLWWRAEDKVNEREFAALHAAWITHSRGEERGSAKVTDSSAAPAPARAGVVHLPKLRRMLLQCGHAEPALDLMLALLIHEGNRAMLRGAGAKGGDSGECMPAVSRAWLSAVERLFFEIDAPGYGYLASDGTRLLLNAVTKVKPLELGLEPAAGKGRWDSGGLATAESAALALLLQLEGAAGERGERGTSSGAAGSGGAAPSSGSYGVVTLSSVKRLLAREGYAEGDLQRLHREVLRVKDSFGGALPRVWEAAVEAALAVAGARTKGTPLVECVALRLYLLVDAVGWLVWFDGQPAAQGGGSLENVAVQLWSSFAAAQRLPACAAAEELLEEPHFVAIFDALSRWHDRRVALVGSVPVVAAAEVAKAAGTSASHTARPLPPSCGANGSSAGANEGGADVAKHPKLLGLQRLSAVVPRAWLAVPEAERVAGLRPLATHIDRSCFSTLTSPWSGALLTEMAATAQWEHATVGVPDAGVPVPVGGRSSSGEHGSAVAPGTPLQHVALGGMQASAIDELHSSAGKRAQGLRSALRHPSFTQSNPAGNSLSLSLSL